MKVYDIIKKRNLDKIKILNTTYRFLKKLSLLFKLKNNLHLSEGSDETIGILFRDNFENELFFLFEKKNDSTPSYDLFIHSEKDKKINQQSLNVVEFFEKALGYEKNKD